MRHSVLIADDNPIIRSAIRIVLQRAGYSICGEAVDGLDAVQKARRLTPDLIVLDLRMPQMNGIEVSAVLRGRLPNTPIMLLTLYDAGPAVAAAAGVNAVVSKADGLKNLPDFAKKLLQPNFDITGPTLSGRLLSTSADL